MGTLAEIVALATQTISLVLWASLPAVIATAATGLLVSLVQALTQLQEQTLAFGFKLIAVVATLYLTLTFVGANFYRFTVHILDSIPRWGL